jgi:hypothetical protein
MTELVIPPVENDVVFICGALRSGTTLLRLMIDGHRLLDNPGEMDFLFEPPLDRNGVPDLDAYRRDLQFNRVFSSLQLKFVDGLGYAEQIRDFVRQLRKPGKRLTINVHRHFDRIPAIFPGARYIHLLRDPRDAAKSAIGMGWAGNVFHGVDHWINSERDFERLARQTSPQMIFSLRNEDLIRAPERELTRVCAFLGVAYDPEMMNYPQRSTYGPPDPKLVEQWRRDLTDREVALIEGKARGMMIARGYAPASAEGPGPGTLEKALIRLDNSAKRLRFSVARHGPLVIFLEFLSRLVPATSLKYYVRRKKAAVGRRHVK